MLCITFLVHSSYINNGFTWLDHGDIEAGRAIIQLRRVPAAFISRFGETSFYRPLVTIVHSVDAAIYKQWSPGFHLTALLIHLAATFVMPFFLRIFFRFTAWQMLIAGLIFGIHPLSWLIVGQLAYRQESLLILFAMLAVFFHTRFSERGKLVNQLLTLISLFLALSAKETGLVIIPLLIIFWELTVNIKKQKKNLLFILELMVILFYLFLRTVAVPELWRTTSFDLSLSQSIGTRLLLLANLVTSLISPIKSALSDAVRIVDVTSITSLFTIVVMLAVSLLVVKKGYRSDWGKALILTFILLLPGLNFIPVPRIGSQHYGYIGVPGLSALVVLFIDYMIKKNHAKIISTVGGVWIVLMASQTFTAGFRLKNDFSLFKQEVANDDNFVEGHYYLGNYYLSQNQYEKASKEYENALIPRKELLVYRPKREIVINLAGVYLSQNKLSRADELYVQAIKTASADTKKYLIFNRALIADREGDYQKVSDLLIPTLGQWRRPEPLVLLAKSLRLLGKNKEAQAALQLAYPYLSEEQKKQLNGF